MKDFIVVHLKIMILGLLVMLVGYGAILLLVSFPLTCVMITGSYFFGTIAKNLYEDGKDEE